MPIRRCRPHLDTRLCRRLDHRGERKVTAKIDLGASNNLAQLLLGKSLLDAFQGEILSVTCVGNELALTHTTLLLRFVRRDQFGDMLQLQTDAPIEILLRIEHGAQIGDPISQIGAFDILW